jgi:hypothetical protein
VAFTMIRCSAGLSVPLRRTKALASVPKLRAICPNEHDDAEGSAAKLKDAIAFDTGNVSSKERTFTHPKPGVTGCGCEPPNSVSSAAAETPFSQSNAFMASRAYLLPSVQWYRCSSGVGAIMGRLSWRPLHSALRAPLARPLRSGWFPQPVAIQRTGGRAVARRYASIDAIDAG